MCSCRFIVKFGKASLTGFVFLTNIRLLSVFSPQKITRVFKLRNNNCWNEKKTEAAKVMFLQLPNRTTYKPTCTGLNRDPNDLFNYFFNFCIFMSLLLNFLSQQQNDILYFSTKRKVQYFF